MGQLMRRHWLPVCLSEEVAERDGAPVRARLLGEDLVVFRDTQGQLGVLDEHCPHRGASLVFGRNEECGLRCLYHGWKFDVDGNCLDMPSEPPRAASIRKSMRTKAYPAREGGGFVWVWMGPTEADARVRAAGLGAAPRTASTAVVKMHAACNWAQVLEGSIDSAHSSSLHSTDMPAARSTAPRPPTRPGCGRPTTRRRSCSSKPTSYGFRYAAIRKPIRNPETHQYVRTTLFIAPVHRADPAQRPVQPGADAGADRRREHHVLLGGLASRPEEGHLAGSVARPSARATVGRRPGCRTSARSSQPGEQLPAGPRSR